MSDSDLELLRNQLYSLADIAIDCFSSVKSDIDSVEERAAILEFDSGLTREDAESIAYASRKIMTPRK